MAGVCAIKKLHCNCHLPVLILADSDEFFKFYEKNYPLILINP